MSLDYVTLSSDSSRSSSPFNYENPYKEHETGQQKTLSHLNKKENITEGSNKRFYSLSDSESDLESIESHLVRNLSNKLVDDNLECLNSEGKRKSSDNLVVNSKRKKIVKQKDTANIKATKQYQRSLKPGECTKYVTTYIDRQLLQYSCLKDVEVNLSEREIKYHVRSNIIKGTVLWDRMQIGIAGSENASAKEEEHVLLCMDVEETITLLNEEMFVTNISFMKETLPEKSITLILCGCGNYLSQSTKEKKTQAVRNISKLLEDSLVKIQMLLGVSHRTVEDSSEFASLVAMFTKAVAETPFKREKQKWEKKGILSWFAVGDSKDCVRVNSSGHGCSLLWQQQLRQFNNVGLDVAKAIASCYPSPQALLEAYKKCKSVTDAEMLLQNIQVNRRCGPLSSMRRIGPELSRKIHTFLTSFSKNQFLSEISDVA